jgi:hypothetical protein
MQAISPSIHAHLKKLAAPETLWADGVVLHGQTGQVIANSKDELIGFFTKITEIALDRPVCPRQVSNVAFLFSRCLLAGFFPDPERVMIENDQITGMEISEAHDVELLLGEGAVWEIPMTGFDGLVKDPAFSFKDADVEDTFIVGRPAEQNRVVFDEDGLRIFCCTCGCETEKEGDRRGRLGEMLQKQMPAALQGRGGALMLGEILADGQSSGLLNIEDIIAGRGNITVTELAEMLGPQGKRIIDVLRNLSGRSMSSVLREVMEAVRS